MTTLREAAQQGDLEAENAKLKQMMVDGVTIQQYIDLDNEVDELRRKLAAAETRLSRKPKPLGYIPADLVHQLEPPTIVITGVPVQVYHGEHTIPIYTEPVQPPAVDDDYWKVAYELAEKLRKHLSVRPAPQGEKQC